MKWWAQLIGRASIRGLAPRTDSVTPYALVVFPIQDALDKCESGWREVGDPAIVIALDDFHKSDTSGGPPYEIAIPDLNAHGKLLNERHDLYFVDYLPTAFRFGGFSGYDRNRSSAAGALSSERRPGFMLRCQYPS